MRRTLFAVWCLCLAASVAGLLSAGPTTAPTQPADKGPVEIVFLHVNETHGAVAGAATTGGYARLATMVKEVRAKPGPRRVFLLHAGDILSKGDDLTRRTLGAANFALMNHLRYDAWVPGNGDFYDGLGVLEARMKEALFPTLAANVTVKATGKPLGRPFVIERAGEVRVAFFGLCVVKTDLPSGRGLEVHDPIETAKRLVPQLSRQADLVVAITHIGYLEDVRLARSVAGIDVILGGHSHSLLAAGQEVRNPEGRTTLVSQAGAMLQHVGVVTVRMARTAEGAGYRREALAARTVPLGAEVKPDAEMLRLIEELRRKAAGRAAA